MPQTLARKLLIFAAVDGLILQPLQPKSFVQQDGAKRERLPVVKVGYKNAVISPVNSLAVDDKDKAKAFEAFGIVGLLTVSTSSFLVSITRREQVAQIHGKPVYVITEVAITPLASRLEATKSIEQTATNLRQNAEDYSDSESDTEYHGNPTVSDDVDSGDEFQHVESQQPRELKKKSSVAEDVISKKGSYGMFADKFFSKNGWAAGRARGLGMSSPNIGPKKTTGADEDIPQASLNIENEIQKPNPQDVAASLLPKLLRTASLLFGSSRSFFFSYDHDLTRSYTNRKPFTGDDGILHNEVDPLYFWNRAIITPFIEARQSSFVLPLIQGFVAQREFDMDVHPGVEAGTDDVELADLTSESEKIQKLADARQHTLEECVASGEIPQSEMLKSDNARSYLLTLISRRSVKRAGLRYLRRGIDSEGNTANSVETEQILSSPDWSSTRPSYSFLQVRGSIPLFWSQTPYSFKPVPQLHQSANTNSAAFSKHFEQLGERYGQILVANLVEKHGVEQAVGEEYEKLMKNLNDGGGVYERPVGFEWFDFHAACRGMKFENVSLLTETLGPVLDSFGYSVKNGSQLSQKQSGILRINCMDCLDRTNVVQSACGRRALEIQLKAEGINTSAQRDQTTQWFNTLWADNGDAISKQYASTSALKGDFTRTRKRNYKGALTDMGLSISRFYSGIVNDYFSQASIDFLLGNVTYLVFAEFESSMTSTDPSISPSRLRQQAIEVCQRLVVSDETEELIGGWALLTPQTPNTIKSLPFEESILLLTNMALYSCRFDWNLEKVSSFERVDLRHVEVIKYGTYIINTLSPSQADEETNLGLVINYKAGKHDIMRVNTRSMSNLEDVSERIQGDLLQSNTMDNRASLEIERPTEGKTSTPEDKIIALKALPAQTVVRDFHGDESAKMNEKQQIKVICAEIERAVKAARRDNVKPDVDLRDLLVSEDIISLAAARKSTGILDQIGHSLKKLVWA